MLSKSVEVFMKSMSYINENKKFSKFKIKNFELKKTMKIEKPPQKFTTS
jgi:hypothetical protein